MSTAGDVRRWVGFWSPAHDVGTSWQFASVLLLMMLDHLDSLLLFSCSWCWIILKNYEVLVILLMETALWVTIISIVFFPEFTIIFFIDFNFNTSNENKYFALVSLIASHLILRFSKCEVNIFLNSWNLEMYLSV